MAGYVTIAVVLVLLLASISGLARQHSHEIYAIWYVFSFFFLLFFFLYYYAEQTGIEVTDVFGDSSAESLRVIYNYLTDVNDEFRLVAALVYLAIGPQLLTYLLSGLSGSANPPMFVRQIGMIATWSVIKFMAALSGILLSHLLAKILFGMQADKFEFVQGFGTISAAFIFAFMQHEYLEREFEFSFMPGFRVHIRVPMLLKIHEFFTRYRRQPDMSPGAEKTGEREWRLNTRWFTFHLRGPVPLTIHDFLMRQKP
jgi:hypothetical protein